MRRTNFGEKLLDRRWKVSDQLIQLKGLVEFDERYRYWIGLKDQIKVEEREEELEKLSGRVKELRDLLEKHSVADVDAVEQVLAQDREIFLKCRGKKPQDVIENLKQMVFRKKLAVDKTFYEVKKKEKELYDIQRKIKQSKDKMRQEEEIVANKEKDDGEKYSAALEYAKTQKDVCRITLDSYSKLLGILKNDSHYFEDLLNMLKEDALVQSNAILRMMTLGQMLSEDFSWVKNEAKKHALSFNSQTKETRLEMKKTSNAMKQLALFNTRLQEYAAFNYPLFQEEKGRSGEEMEARTALADLEEFRREWSTCLGAQEQKDFFPKLLKISRLNGVVRKRLESLGMERNLQEETCMMLELVMAELDNWMDDEVRKDLREILHIDKEIQTIAQEMQNLQKQEEEIYKEMDIYKTNIYQLKRMLGHVFIGPPFCEGMYDGGYEKAINQLRFETNDFQLLSDNEDEESVKEDMDAIARGYLDPNITFDMKDVISYQTSLVLEEDPIQLLDNVMMQMKTINEALSPEIMSREPTEEELLGLGDFYVQVQADADTTIAECMEQDKILYKRFKPKSDDFHKKNCTNKSRMEMKMDSEWIVFEKEGPVVGLVVNKGSLHPPGVIRGMYVPETDSSESDDDEKKEEEVKDEKDDDDVDYAEDTNQSPSSSDGEQLDSDLDPDEPKPHICF